ncbi:MAG: alanine--tRNA ligase [Gaiellaceae bacterium]
MRTTAELREGFLSFFESKGHRRHPSGSLIPPAEDVSTLFTVAGMQPLQGYFLGLKPPPAPRLVTVQKVMRAGGKHNDLDDVGSTVRHASFFEMLGNFSFGEYFKDGAVDLAWEFATEQMGFRPEQLSATVFGGDPELGLELDEVAIAAWERVGIPRERIRGQPRAENFWQAAETGPCGPNTEIFLDRGAEHGCGQADCGPNCPRCERFLEFWNLVFMEFDLREDGALVPLPKQNVDTGMGFERAAMLLQDAGSIFEIDNVRALMAHVEEHAGVRYGDSELVTKACRVIADHSRAATFLIADGVLPSNEGRGYVLRRVIRRAVQFGRRIGLESPFMPELADIVREQMSAWYPELEENRDSVQEFLRAEEERFSETLERGLGLFEEAAAAGDVTGEDAFRLHDTYGFPLEVTRELALERGLAVDEETFTRLMSEQRERSRERGAFEIKLAGGPPTDFVGYEKTEVLTAIAAYAEQGDGLFQAKLFESPFYPEGGGQVSDGGFVEHRETGARAELVKATRLGDDQVLTFRGEGFAEGDRVRAVVPWNVRFPTMANHTATHLLHRALREVLGDHVRQAGSAVRPDKLRFDFTHPGALGAEERGRVERIVNEKIFENLPVRTFVTPIEEARRLGATMLFGEKYGDEVRVVEIDGFSSELCGGTHVRSTAEIGPFVLVSESSVGSGARRIEALTSGEAFALLRSRALEADELRAELEAARKEARRRPVAEEAAAGPEVVAERRNRAGDVEVIVLEVRSASPDDLLALSDRLMQQHAPAAIVLGSRENGSAHLVLNFDRSLEARGLDAGRMIQEAAPLIGGGGGGRPSMARAGGKQPAGLPDALAAAESLILERLA